MTGCGVAGQRPGIRERSWASRPTASGSASAWALAWVRPRCWSAPAPGCGSAATVGSASGVGSALGVGSAVGSAVVSAVGVGRGLGWPPSSDLADRRAVVAGQGVTRHQFHPGQRHRGQRERGQRAGRDTLPGDPPSWGETVRLAHSSTGLLTQRRSEGQRAGSGPPTRERVPARRASRAHNGLDPVTRVGQRCGVQRSGHGGHDAGHGGADDGARPHSAGSRARPRSSRPARRRAILVGDRSTLAVLGFLAGVRGVGVGGTSGFGVLLVLMSSDSVYSGVVTARGGLVQSR